MKRIWRTSQFHELFKIISILYLYQNHEMWVTSKVFVREICFCKKILSDFKASWIFQKYFNFVPILESRNVDLCKSICSWVMFLSKIQADFSVSSVIQKYFNFVPMIESQNVDQVKCNCLWDMFLWKEFGGLPSFMSFSKLFQFCTHVRFKKCGSREK